jgi:TolB-like protein/DNA-binding winged helix-turn-helix (wHTH) protein/Tfp pilus assembly protein PilF
MRVYAPSRQIRFGLFEVDLHTGELRKQGLRLTLKGQPFEVLAMLLARPGEMVTREELQKKLWPGDTFVDFEHGLNTAVNKLREALGDSAENPRFVETLARRGYRFIYPVEGSAASRGAPSLVGKILALQAPTGKCWFLALTAALMVALVSLLLTFNVAGLRDRLLRHTVPVPKIESIAVLPLENLSHNPEEEYFADGMTDALIAELGQIGSLRVISRTSAMRYKKSNKPLPQIARELNVDAVIEGSVFRAGDRVRITAELIGAVPERHLWARNYERDLRDVLTLQGEIARAIAGEVKASVTPDVRARLASARPVDPGAYQAYMRGRYLLFKTADREGVRKALSYFQQAIEKDPDFALGYWGIAEFYIDLANEIEMPPNEAFGKARAAVVKSLQTEPGRAEAHATLGYIRYQFDWDWGGAEKELKRAIELNPNSADSHYRYGCFLTIMARWEESLAERERAADLDPWVIGTYALWDHYWLSRQYDKAIEIARWRVEMQPNNAFSHAVLGWPYVQKGMYAEAISEFEKAVTLAPRELRLRADLGRIYAEAGRTAQAKKILRELQEPSQQTRPDPYHVALIYIGLREKGKALEWLEKAYEDRNPWMDLLKVDPWLDPLRSDPRFQDLLRRMNFPP